MPDTGEDHHRAETGAADPLGDRFGGTVISGLCRHGAKPSDRRRAL
jgi:hypothetical protein